MKSIKYVLFVIILLVSCSCATTKLSSFSIVNAPGEDSCVFKQITTEGQFIIGPEVIQSGNKIRWYTGSVFDVSSDGENIVYIAGTGTPGGGNIMVKSLTADSSSARRTSNIDAANPRFSPDGVYICFSGTLKGQQGSDICIIDTYEGNAVRHLTERQSAEDSAPVFTSDGDEIIFTRGLPVTEIKGGETVITWQYTIWSSALSYPATKQFVEGSSPEYLYDNKILYTKANPTTFQGEIWMYNLLSGSDSLLLYDYTRGFSTPRVSPDGKKVLCTGLTMDKKGKASNLDIYLFNVDGTGLKQITFHPGTDASPCWSPDGDMIYFISQRGNGNGDYNIWSVKLSEILTTF